MALNKTTILITGGLGQIGIAITKHLQAKYPTAVLHVLDLTVPSPDDNRFISHVEYHKGTITSQSDVTRIFSKVNPEIVFHTAGLIPQIAAKLGMDTEEGYMGVNFEGTRIVLEEAKKVGSVRAFVYTSSADVVKGTSWTELSGVNEDFPIPETFDGIYSRSKARAEAIVLSSSSPSFPTVAIRTHAVFSADDRNLLPLIMAAPRNIRLGAGTNLYDFTYAPNLALAHELAAVNLLTTNSLKEEGEGVGRKSAAAGQAIFATNAEPIPFAQFIRWVHAAYDKDLSFDGDRAEGEKWKVTTVPIGLSKVVVGVGEKIASVMGKRPVLTVKDLGDSLSERWFDNSRAKEVLGYVPVVGLREGVRLAVEGWKGREKGGELR